MAIARLARSLILITACSTTIGFAGEAPEIALRSRVLRAPTERSEALAALAAVPVGESRHAIVQLTRPPTVADRDALRHAGVELVQYLPVNGWFVVVRGGFDLDARGLEVVRGSWGIEPADRLDPRLRGEALPAHIVEGRDLRLVVLPFDGVDPTAIVRRIAELGGVTVSPDPREALLTVRLPAERLVDLATTDGVHWIAPAASGPQTELWSVRQYLHTDAVRAAPYGLTGAGVGVSVHEESGPHAHTDFASRIVSRDADASAYQGDHTTKVAGTIAGDGRVARDQGAPVDHSGMAPAALLACYAYDIGETWEANNFLDITTELAAGQTSVANNSWGYGGGCTAHPYNEYTFEATVFDEQVRGRSYLGEVIGSPMTVVFSAGNERDGYPDPDDPTGPELQDCLIDTSAPYVNYGTLNQPKPAKNPIVVGAVNGPGDSMTEFSSWGPTADGRVKPDLVADGSPYTAPDSRNLYSTFAMTSGAAAQVSGNVALLVEDYRNGHGGADPPPSLVKALVLHGARDLDDGTTWFNRGPDYASGFGLLDIQAAVDQLRSGQWSWQCVVGDSTWGMPLPVPPNSGTVRVTVAWDDPPGSPATSGPALVHDLDLEVTDIRGARRFPWTLDPVNPSAPAVRTVRNSVDNVEQVVAEVVGGYGTWDITVRGVGFGQFAVQCFSIAYSVDEIDGDGDGSPISQDCDDTDPARFPANPEVCDAVDNDCDGVVDDGLSDDDDGDGHFRMGSCAQPADDCNDAAAEIRPGGDDTCNTADDDCSGVPDEGCDRVCDQVAASVPHRLSEDLAESAVLDLTWNWTAGRFAAVWVQQTVEGRRVLLREMAPDLSPLGAPVVISGSETVRPVSPAVVWTGSAYGVAWSNGEGPPAVYFRAWSPGLASEVRVVGDADVGAWPAVAWTGDGFGVVWKYQFSIQYRRLDPDGTPVGLAVPVVSGTPSAGYYRPDVVWNGSRLACLVRGDADGTLHFREFDTSGLVHEAAVVTAVTGAWNSRMAWNGNGYGIAWWQRVDDAYDVRFARLARDGTLLGDPLVVSPASPSTTAPSLAWTGAEYGVAYARDGSNWLSRIDAGGAIVDDPLAVNGLPGEPQVAWNGAHYGLGWVWNELPSTWSVWGTALLCCDDLDGDGVTECESDCDEGDPAVYPGAPQLCDGVHNDCSDVSWPAIPESEADLDFDGVMACAGDCDDFDATIAPGRSEICDLRDDDCDGVVDDGLDADLDGHADCLDACPRVHDPGQPSPAAIVAAGTSLTRVDLVLGTAATVASALAPQWVVVDAAGSTAVVTQTLHNGSLSRIDLGSGAVADLCLDLLDPTGVDYGPTETTAYVGRGVGKLHEVVLAACDPVTIATGLGNVAGVRRGPDGVSVYVTDRDGGRLLRKRLDDGTVATVADGLNVPLGLDLDAAGTFAYVAEHGADRIVRVALVDGTVTTVAAGLDAPVDVALGPSGATLFALLGGTPFEYRDGSLWLVDLATGIARTVHAPIEAPRSVDLVHRICAPSTCADLDGDGYGSPGVVDCPAGPLPDCDDGLASRHPGGLEACNGIDDDCDGAVPAAEFTDGDGDGYGGCTGDCNDAQPNVRPDAVESCNAVDDDCDAWLDEGCDGACNNPEAAVDLLTPDAVDAGSGRLAWTGQGYGVVWSDTRTGDREVYFALLDAAMHRIGPEVRLSNAPGVSESPWIVWTGQEFGVVWEDARDGGTRVYFVRVDPAGTKLGLERAVAAADGATSRTPRVLWTGRQYGLFWNDDRDGSWENYFRTIDANGEILGTPQRITPLPDVSNPCQAVWTGSGYAVVYNDVRTGDFEVYLARLDDSGRPIGPEQRLTYLSGPSRSPAILFRGDEYGLFWLDTAAGPNELWYARVALDGTKIGPDVRLTPASGPLPLYAAAWTGNEYGVTWIDSHDGNPEVYFRRFDTAGAPLSPELRVTSDPAQNAYPMLRWNGSDFGLVFIDNRSSSYQLHGARIACCDDPDGDGANECHDCDEADPATRPGAVEINDGRDNQCPGEPGYGTADEISGPSGFRDPGDDATLSWDPQPGATQYQVARATDPAFANGCATFLVSTNAWTDPDAVPPAEQRYYLVRPVAPWIGSWGVDSSGAERNVPCDSELRCEDGGDDDGDGRADCEDPDCAAVPACVPAVFSFLDGTGDDVARTALKTFFQGLSAAPGDFLRFEIAGGSPTDGAWCAVRADWYVSTYLSSPAPNVPLDSGTWSKWTRTQSGAWTGPITEPFPNLYGAQGATGSYSWLSEQGLGGLRLHVIPGNTNHCEAVDSNEVCDAMSTPRRARLTIAVGRGRLPTCGF